MLVKGRLYKRSVLHDKYGGNRQRGISPSTKADLIFIFTADSGKEHGYEDGWKDDKTFHYSGEGQLGDMRFERGNKAIRDHISNGKSLYLFEQAIPGYVKFLCEMKYIGHHEKEGFDRGQNRRKIIVFELEKIGNFSSSVNNNYSEKTQCGSFDKDEWYCIICGTQLDKKTNLCGSDCQQKYRTFRSSHKVIFSGYCNICGELFELRKGIVSKTVPECHNNCNSKKDLSSSLFAQNTGERVTSSMPGNHSTKIKKEPINYGPFVPSTSKMKTDIQLSESKNTEVPILKESKSDTPFTSLTSEKKKHLITREGIRKLGDMNNSPSFDNNSISNPTQKYQDEQARNEIFYCVVCGTPLDRKTNLCGNGCRKKYNSFSHSDKVTLSGYCNICGKTLFLKKELAYKTISETHSYCHSKKTKLPISKEPGNYIPFGSSMNERKSGTQLSEKTDLFSIIMTTFSQQVSPKLKSDINKLNTSACLTVEELKALKIGGLDLYSSKKLLELGQDVGPEIFKLVEKSFPNSKRSQASVLRWIERGLKVEIAIRKVNMDIDSYSTKKSKNDITIREQTSNNTFSSKSEVKHHDSDSPVNIKKDRLSKLLGDIDKVKTKSKRRSW